MLLSPIFFAAILLTRYYQLLLFSDNSIDMHRKVLFSLIAIVFSTAVIAQTLDDALRYSLQEYSGTARFAGVSGAFSPLGADISVASTNPAGIAEFRKSEITATVNYLTTGNESVLDGSGTNINKSKVGLSNLGAVFHYDPPAFNTRTLNLAIGFNQLMNYSETVSYAGRGPGSVVERFIEVANGNTPDELDLFQSGPAFDAGAIFDLNNDDIYESDFATFGSVVDRSEVIERSGSLNEVFIAVASNIKNKISWGVTLGFPFANFSEVKNYEETDPLDEIDIFNSINYNQDLQTSGVGFNLKLGFIYKPIPRLRFGAAFHTPSFYFLKDEFNTDINYSFTANGNTESFSAGSNPNRDPFEYQFQSPWRALAGLGYLYSAGDLKGFLSGEVEYVSYTSGSFNLTANSNDPFDQFFEDDLNNEIDGFLTSALNIRVGTELAYKMFRIRLGAMLPSSPFADASAWDFNPSFSAGIGYRANRFYVDAAITLRSSTTNYSPYPLIDQNREPFVAISTDRSAASVTFGYKI